MGKRDTTVREVSREGCGAFLRQIGIERPLRPIPFKPPRVTAREGDFVGEDETRPRSPPTRCLPGAGRTSFPAPSSVTLSHSGVHLKLAVLRSAP